MDILVSRPVPGPALESLRQAGHTLTVLPEERSQAEFERLFSRAEGVLSMLSDPINTTLLATAPRLRVVANYAVGFNNIDTAAASKAGIAVTNTPDVLTDATADVAMILLLMTMRRVSESQTLLREGQFIGWRPNMLLGHDLRGKNLGIIGLGRIGLAVADRARAFGMNIFYTSRSGPKSESPFPCVPLETLLRDSDAISVHCPLTPDTRHLLGASQLRLMKKSAVLINTARGPVIDEAALADALREKQIFAAGLDVYEEEPKVHPGLLRLENVVLLPHIGSGTIETRTRMADLAAEGILSVLSGKLPRFLVNPEVRAHTRWNQS